VRAFIRLREIARTNVKLSQKLAELERRVSDHDEILMEVIREMRKLIDIPKRKGRKTIIGFMQLQKQKRQKQRDALKYPSYSICWH